MLSTAPSGSPLCLWEIPQDTASLLTPTRPALCPPPAVPGRTSFPPGPWKALNVTSRAFLHLRLAFGASLPVCSPSHPSHSSCQGSPSVLPHPGSSALAGEPLPSCPHPTLIKAHRTQYPRGPLPRRSYSGSCSLQVSPGLNPSGATVLSMGRGSCQPSLSTGPCPAAPPWMCLAIQQSSTARPVLHHFP